MILPSAAQRRALRIGALYAGLAGLWILGADRALASLELDPVLTGWLSTLHRLAFIAITAVLLVRLVLQSSATPAPAAVALGVPDWRMRLIVAGAAAVVITVILVQFAYSLPQQRQRILELASDNAQNLARVTAAQARTSFGALDATLSVLTRAMLVLPGADTARDDDIHQRLLANLANLPQARALWIIDARGQLLHDSERRTGTYNVSDRDYFKVHRDNPARGFFIEPNLVGRDGLRFMATSRRISRADGSFGGVVVAVVDPAYFEAFYASIDIGAAGTLALLGSDATLIARTPASAGAKDAQAQSEPALLGSLNEGSGASSRSAADGVDRIFAYRKVGRYPLVVQVGLSEDDALAPWRAAALVNGAAALALSALVGWLGFMTLSEFARRGQAHRELDTSTRRLQLAVQAGRIGLSEEDLRSHRVRYSPEWSRRLGYEEDEIGDDAVAWQRRVHPDDLERVRKAMAEFVTDPRPDLEIEFRFRHKDGSYRWILTRGAIEQDAKGQPIRLIGAHIDLTERKAAEAALRESEAHFRATFEQAAIGIAHVALDGRWLRINRKLCDIVGYDKAELVSLRFQDITHPDDLEADLDQMRALIYGKLSTYTLEKRYLRKNGEAVWIRLTVALVRGPEREPLYFISIINDIDEHRRAERALAQTRSRLEAVVASAMDAIVGVDDLHRVMLFNPAAEAMFGWTEAAIVGQPLSRLVPDALRGLNASQVRQAPAAAPSSRRRVALSALRGVRADGSSFSVEASISRVQQGDQRLFTLVLRDVSERERIEQFLRDAATRYRQLFEGNPHPMWIRDAQTLACLQVNDAALLRFGYSRDEFLALSVEDLLSPERAQELRSRAGSPGGFKASPTDTVWRLRTKQGELIDIEVTTQNLEVDGRAAIATLAHDVTERRRAAKEVLESREALRALLHRLNRAQEEERIRVAREVHDELGQQLTGLKMDLRWIERRLSDPGLGAQLLPVLDRVVAAAELNDLTITTVQKLAAELRPGALDQLGLPAALAQRVRQFEQRTGLACTLHCAEELAALPVALASELFYICQEALTNITRHAQARHVIVQLALEHGQVRLQVEDDGVGADLTAPALTGSLGLLGMRERARHNGGTITLEAVIPHGLRVVAVVPWPGVVTGNAGGRSDADSAGR